MHPLARRYRENVTPGQRLRDRVRIRPRDRARAGSVLGSLLAGAGVLAAVVLGVIVLTRYLGDPSPPHPVTDPTRTIDVISAEGYADLLAAIEDETGDTAVFDATLYPTYATLDLPAAPRGRAETSWFWNGTLVSQQMQGTSESPRIDLATIDPAVLVRLVERARTELVRNPTTVYVVVRAPSGHRKSPLIVHATNALGRSGYLAATSEGRITKRLVRPPQSTDR